MTKFTRKDRSPSGNTQQAIFQPRSTTDGKSRAFSSSPLTNPLKEKRSNRKRNILKVPKGIIRKDIDKTPKSIQNLLDVGFGFGFDYDKHSDILPSHRKAIPCLEYWNNLPRVPRHIQAGTKIRQKSIKALRQIMRGVFYKHVSLDVVWMKRNNVDLSSIIGKEMSVATINDVLYSLSRYYDHRYWPPDKTVLPSTLFDALWHSINHSSFFLQAIFNPTHRIDLTDDVLIDDDPYMTKSLVDLFIDKLNLSVHSSDKPALINGIKTICDFRLKIPRGRYATKINHWFGTNTKLCNEYIQWLNDQAWLDNPSVHLVNSHNKLFDKFIAEQEDDLGIPLR